MLPLVQDFYMFLLRSRVAGLVINNGDFGLCIYTMKGVISVVLENILT